LAAISGLFDRCNDVSRLGTGCRRTSSDFDFELADTNVALISALNNKDERTGPNPDEFNRIPT
jgi:hypothetical protein